MIREENYSSEYTASNYLYKELFYDSNLEKENIKNGVSEVTDYITPLFTKLR